ncbi:MmcQ/YjbR family DNA-binding protein [Mangrovivirga sp. M17]|uniref:MmcQ/YjbR family DNA-binding protein n=1 Tax=Mangrovivirga halotolerans TaxID=2993936 RepID=A0ABT3RVI8_9BACT|nr:MmcQ/YjbR family DNA-binding protein [Mangrovivirga halotolerans]MCX2745775.1 MmcQ/YjbR family DNA-binding protein [Mangrovivirga halotolerans]
MNIEDFRAYCLSLPYTSEDMPFGEDVLTFRVHGKIFALTGITEFKSINLKCDPERALELRERFDFVKPGYHMNKKHWNTVELSPGCSDSFLKDLVKHSYDCVHKTLPKKLK